MPCARALPLSLTLSQSVSAGIVVPGGAAPICAAIDGSKIHSRYQKSTRKTRLARAQRHGKSSENSRLDTPHNMRKTQCAQETSKRTHRLKRPSSSSSSDTSVPWLAGSSWDSYHHPCPYPRHHRARCARQTSERRPYSLKWKEDEGQGSKATRATVGRARLAEGATLTWHKNQPVIAAAVIPSSAARHGATTPGRRGKALTVYVGAAREGALDFHLPPHTARRGLISSPLRVCPARGNTSI